MQSLKKTLMWNKDRRRMENTLRLDILEAKGLTDKKKKYYVEILVDDKLYARTASKKLGDLTCCFWGEQFEFKDLPPTNKVNLLIYKDKGTSSRNKPKKPVGRVKISMCSIQSRYIQDKWYQVEKSSRRETPSLRLRCQYQSVDILPLRDYEDLLYFLKDEYKDLCKMLEPNISVKVKEELSVSLMSIFHYEVRIHLKGLLAHTIESCLVSELKGIVGSLKGGLLVCTPIQQELWGKTGFSNKPKNECSRLA